jgi:uncharacterized protein YukE
MSVHGEYARALESLIARLRLSTHPNRDRWLGALEAARPDRNPDLSTAATACRALLHEIAATLEQSADHPPDGARTTAEDAAWLLDAHDHLLAHCRALLGPEGPAREPDQPSSTRSTR